MRTFLEMDVIAGSWAYSYYFSDILIVLSGYYHKSWYVGYDNHDIIHNVSLNEFMARLLHFR
jgi:hypothetical protein